MPNDTITRAIASTRRRLAAQRFLDHSTTHVAAAFGVGFLLLLVNPGRLLLPGVGLLIAVVVAAIRTLREYPSPVAAALELDSRFALNERVTASLGLTADQRETEVGRAVQADADSHIEGVRVASRFPLRLGRSARLTALTAILFTTTAFVWNPAVSSDRYADSEQKQGELARTTDDKASRAGMLFPKASAEVMSAKANSERVAAIRAELDRLDRESRNRENNPMWLAELTAIEDAARAVERESLDRLARMENQLKQLEPLAKSPEFQQGSAAEVAKSLANGDLANAEKALADLAQAAAENPTDQELRKQVEQLAEALKNAAENTAARERLEQLIEQAKQDGRDTTGLQQELDRAEAESQQTQPLKDLARKLEQAAKQMEKGDRTEAAKQLSQAANAVGEIRKDVRTTQAAAAQAERAGKLRSEASGKGRESNEPGGGAAENPIPPKQNDTTNNVKLAPARIPFVDPRGAMTPIGPGDFGGDFTKVDPSRLAPAIRNAVQAAPAAVVGPPLTPADRTAVREFFELLGK
jgi:hypothetical protein